MNPATLVHEALHILGGMDDKAIERAWGINTNLPSIYITQKLQNDCGL